MALGITTDLLLMTYPLHCMSWFTGLAIVAVILQPDESHPCVRREVINDIIGMAVSAFWPGYSIHTRQGCIITKYVVSS